MSQYYLPEYVASSIRNLSGTDTIAFVEEVFKDDHLIEKPVMMGANQKTKKKEQLVQLTRVSEVGDENKWREAVRKSRLKSSDVFNDHKWRLNFSFYFTLFLSFLATVLILWLIYKGSAVNDSLKWIIGALPSFLSVTVFWIYRLESKKMEVIEKDIRELHLLEQKLAMASMLGDKKLTVELFKNI